MGARAIRAGIGVTYGANTSDVDFGDVVIQGELVGIAAGDIKVGKPGKIWLTGVFNIVKTTGVSTSIPAGSLVYWDATNKVATVTVGANKLIGKSIRLAEDGDRFVRVMLTP